MIIAIVGGTGTLGQGLALRLCSTHEVLIGSRDREKGEAEARSLSSRAGVQIVGGLNEEVTKKCDAAILAISYTPSLEALNGLAGPLSGKLVLSPVVPMKVTDGIFRYAIESGSAAEQIASKLARSRVAASLHTIPAVMLLNRERKLGMDALVAADTKEVFEEAAGIVRSIEGIRPLHAGPLSQARSVEGLTPLLLNLAKFGGLKSPSIRFV